MARLTHDAVAENLRALGFTRVVADGATYHLEELPPKLNLTRTTELLILVDRLVAAGHVHRATLTQFAGCPATICPAWCRLFWIARANVSMSFSSFSTSGL